MQQLTKFFGEEPPPAAHLPQAPGLRQEIQVRPRGSQNRDAGAALRLQGPPGEPKHSHRTHGTENFGRVQDHRANSFGSCQWVRGSCDLIVNEKTTTMYTSCDSQLMVHNYTTIS